MTKCTYGEVLQWASSFLQRNKQESYLAEYLLLERQGWNKTDLVSHLREPMPAEVWLQLNADLMRAVENYPPQYIIGFCDFLDQRFKVTEATLIPRPETEELVMLCLERHAAQKNLKVVDVGTGSGVIALSLKQSKPDWHVTAIDISADALAIAQENASHLNQQINFLEGDVLTPVLNQTFDVIISNPPYISYDELAEMDESVKQHEPSIALFADQQGLAVYQQIAQQAVQCLAPGGCLYLEIGYRQGEDVKRLFTKTFPTKKVTVLSDMSGCDRIIAVES